MENKISDLYEEVKNEHHLPLNFLSTVVQGHKYVYIPRSSKKKGEKLIRATLQCQRIKCSLGPGNKAKKRTPAELLVPIQLQWKEGNMRLNVGWEALPESVPFLLLLSLGKCPRSYKKRVTKCASDICKVVAHRGRKEERSLV